MQKLERGFENIVRGVREKVRNLVPLHADSIEALVELAERERVLTLEVRSFVEIVCQAKLGTEWGVFPVTSSSPDIYLPRTRYEAKGLGRRILMDEIYPELDSRAGKRELMIARLRCELTAEHRREMLAGRLPNVDVRVKGIEENEQEYRRTLLDAQTLRLTPYELKEI
ncbi:MAG: hypothetical protein HYT11_03265 [Candidatus Levybacteria bacterium]|nr:hypothetical protein [Candidatus Levybacteria bacterium]